MSTAKETREWEPLAAYLETLVADEVLRESCGDAVESAENLLATLRAEEKERKAAVSGYVCQHIMQSFGSHQLSWHWCHDYVLSCRVSALRSCKNTCVTSRRDTYGCHHSETKRRPQRCDEGGSER